MTVVLILLVGFEIKHFLADYVFQTSVMLEGKGNLFLPGGYLHAGLHSVLSFLVLVLAGTGLGLALLLVAAEFVVHYLTDFSKSRYSRNVHFTTDPARYWRLHGFDQLLHQLTYVVMIAAALAQPGKLAG